MNDPLYYARAVHFAPTIMASGIVFFAMFVADPALRRAQRITAMAATLRSRLAPIAWISLVLAGLSRSAKKPSSSSRLLSFESFASAPPSSTA
ncbi:MAG: hypothetical protein ACREHV_12260 [Rhizomicrobium sp.]